MIIGRSIGQAFPPRPGADAPSGAEVLRRRRSRRPARKLSDVSFDLHAGEILGIAGLQGMGQLDLFLACFGMAEIEPRRRSRSTASRSTIASPADAMRANIGISLVPEDRKTEALVPQAQRQAQRLAPGDRAGSPRSA